MDVALGMHNSSPPKIGGPAAQIGSQRPRRPGGSPRPSGRVAGVEDLGTGDTPGASDAALGTFFLGTRREEPLPNQVILEDYQSAVANASVTATS